MKFRIWHLMPLILIVLVGGFFFLRVNHPLIGTWETVEVYDSLYSVGSGIEFGADRSGRYIGGWGVPYLYWRSGFSLGRSGEVHVWSGNLPWTRLEAVFDDYVEYKIFRNDDGERILKMFGTYFRRVQP